MYYWFLSTAILVISLLFTMFLITSFLLYCFVSWKFRLLQQEQRPLQDVHEVDLLDLLDLENIPEPYSIPDYLADEAPLNQASHLNHYPESHESCNEEDASTLDQPQGDESTEIENTLEFPNFEHPDNLPNLEDLGESADETPKLSEALQSGITEERINPNEGMPLLFAETDSDN
jgi:hypothetical protein